MRILLFADIHIGSINDTNYVRNVMENIIEKEIILNNTDLVVILGDYFERLFNANDEFTSTAIDIMTLLVRSCRRNNTKIRIVYGTESHEMSQYKLFGYHLSSKSIDMKVYTTSTEEVIDGKKILFVPEEYIESKQDHYKDTLYNDKKCYDYIFGHGIIVEGMPDQSIKSINPDNKEKQVPRFKSKELSNKCGLCVFGHQHKHTQMESNVYYLGSLFRSSFGEEDPKGYGIIEDNDKLMFVENTRAYVYRTITFSPDSDIYKDPKNLNLEFDKAISVYNQIVNNTDPGKLRIVFELPENVDKTFKDRAMALFKKNKRLSVLIRSYTYTPDNGGLIDEDESQNELLEFILDSSLGTTEKIQRFINIKHGVDIDLSKLTRYLFDDIFSK